MTDWADPFIQAKASIARAERDLTLGQLGPARTALEDALSSIGKVFNAIGVDQRAMRRLFEDVAVRK